MSKSKNKLRVSFPGGCATDVTGSCILLETDDIKILLDCGLFQGGTILAQYKENKDFFKKNKIKPSAIDYIFIEHAHADHAQLVELAVKEGFRGQIIMPSGNLDFFKIMAVDSSTIMQRDAEDLSKKIGKEIAPIYNLEDIAQTLLLIKECPFEEKIKLTEELSFRFFPTGHIINSGGIELWVKYGNKAQHIVYTSDLGNQQIPQYFIKPLKLPQNANLLIGECTYARPTRNATNKDREKDLEKILSIVRETCCEKKGKVLIPVFTLHRAQTMLSVLYDIFKNDLNFNIPIILASPLGVKMSHLYEEQLTNGGKAYFSEVMAWKNIHLVSSFDEMAKWCDGSTPCVLLSASGMMTAGYSKYAASKFLPHSKNHIVFVGYSVENSLASKIKDHTTKSVSIDGKQISCRALISDLKSFSSHASYDDLIKIYSSNNYDKIVLVHGNFNDKLLFANELKQEMEKRNKTGKIISTNKDTVISF